MKFDVSEAINLLDTLDYRQSSVDVLEEETGNKYELGVGT